MLKFKCAERIIEADNAPPYDFSRRLNNRWFFVCLVGRNCLHGERTRLEQVREIARFRSPAMGRQIANWLKNDERIAALVGYDSPTKGPYFLKDDDVEFLDGDPVFVDLGLEPRGTRWRTRIHLHEYIAASGLFQNGKIIDAVKKCHRLLSSKTVDWGLRFECTLLLARSYTAVGFFDQAKAALAGCAELVPEFMGRAKIAEAKVDYFGERYDEARRALDAPALRNLPWFSRADWCELSALVEGRKFRALSDEVDSSRAGDVPSEQRRLRKLAASSYRRAQRYLERALSLRLLHGDPHGVQAACFNLGNLMVKEKREESRAWIEMSEDICSRWSVGRDTILAQFVLARLDLLDGNRSEAWRRAQDAFRLAHTRDNVFDRATAHRQHARYHFTVAKTDRDLRKALAHAFICSRIYTALGLTESIHAFERDFPQRISEASRMFGTNLEDACGACQSAEIESAHDVADPKHAQTGCGCASLPVLRGQSPRKRA